MSIDRWMDKEDVLTHTHTHTHTHNGILLSHKKNDIIPFAVTWMDLDYHTKWSKSGRERQIPHYITYMWNLKYNINEHIYETESDS